MCLLWKARHHSRSRPAKEAIPTPRPSDLITVPSCKVCNTRLSAEEEYFIHVLLSDREADTTVIQKLREQRFSQNPTARQVRMARRMLSSMHEKEVRTAGGIYLGTATAFTVDRIQIDRVIEKITYGLYFTEFGRRCPAGGTAEVYLKPPGSYFDDPGVMQIINGGRGRSIGEQAFGYRIAYAIELPGLVFCYMLFFEAIPAVCTLQPSTDVK
jgi:hypothetical protein